MHPFRAKREHSQLYSRRCDPRLVKKLRHAYGTYERRPSEFQHKVSTVLSQIGWEHELEYVTEDGLSLDMARPSAKCGIEVDGPSHFLWNPWTKAWVENGPTRLKSRLLKARGWRVVSIPFYEWDKIATSASKHDYIKAKLEHNGDSKGM
mmetsp:Transcript_4631/g.11922  ORF Transcript_4631/g.11922 Transcript_4631/m.11922 type:complete len:150 (-) Transcript_4631:146-595(-)